MNAVNFQLPPGKQVTVIVTSDLTVERSVFPQFPPEGYFHKAVVSLSNGKTHTFQTPVPAIDQPVVYGGPFQIDTGLNGLDVTVTVSESMSVNGQPSTNWQPMKHHLEQDGNAAVVYTEGHTGSQGGWNQRGIRYDWDDTVVRCLW